MRRLLRFRLRTLLILIALCALLSGWFGLRYRQFSREQEIAATWRGLGATVRFGSDWLAMPSVKDVEWKPFTPASPEWRPTDVHLAQLADLPQLQSVLITDGGFGDAQLRHFRDCHRLRFLLLNRMPITDAGLVHLEHLPELQTLDLTQTAVTDAGLARLNESSPDLVILDD